MANLVVRRRQFQMLRPEPTYSQLVSNESRLHNSNPSMTTRSLPSQIISNQSAALLYIGPAVISLIWLDSTVSAFLEMLEERAPARLILLVTPIATSRWPGRRGYRDARLAHSVAHCTADPPRHRARRSTSPPRCPAPPGRGGS